MSPLTREQILAAADREYTRVPVPEWGGEVLLASPSLADRDAYANAQVAAARNGQPVPIGHRASLVVRCLVDESGARLFADDEAKLLAEKNAEVIDRLFDVAQVLAGLVEGNVAQLTEEMIKNSGRRPNGASNSPSP